jgi:hypothetical protein
LSSDANTSAFQIGKCNMITLALSAEPVLLSHAEILEAHFTRVGRVLPHLALNATDTITGLPGFNDEAAYASFAERKVRSSKDQSNVGVLARSDELLCSIENVTSVPALGTRSDSAGVRTALRFAEAERAQKLTPRHRPQIFFLLRRRSVRDQRHAAD